MKYDFEECLERNEVQMSVVDARRFGCAVRAAMQLLEREATCYGLTDEAYYLDVQDFLGKMAARLDPDLEDAAALKRIGNEM